MLVAGEPYMAINPADAEKAGIANGETVTITSLTGSVSITAQISGGVQPGTLFMPSHFQETSTGLITNKHHYSFDVALKK